MLGPNDNCCAIFFKMLLRYGHQARRGRTKDRPRARPGLRVAAGWRGAVVRICAERPELRRRVDTADHGNRTGLVLAIERRRFGRVEFA